MRCRGGPGAAPPRRQIHFRARAINPLRRPFGIIFTAAPMGWRSIPHSRNPRDFRIDIVDTGIIFPMVPKKRTSSCPRGFSEKLLQHSRTPRSRPFFLQVGRWFMAEVIPADRFSSSPTMRSITLASQELGVFRAFPQEFHFDGYATYISKTPRPKGTPNQGQASLPGRQAKQLTGVLFGQGEFF